MRGEAAEIPNARNRNPLNFRYNGLLKLGFKVQINTKMQQVQINPTNKVL